MTSRNAQQLLQAAWHGGRKGTLSASSQARIWAIREEWRAQGKSEHGLLTHVVGKVGREKAQAVKIDIGN